jgi:hypothetical protein
MAIDLLHHDHIDLKPNRTQLVVGSNRVHYSGDTGTPTANLLTVKLLLISVISTKDAQFMTMDINDFYLNTLMACYKYMRLQMFGMPEDIIEYFKLCKLATLDGSIYCEIRKETFSLPQAGISAQQLLEENLIKHGYCQSETTPGLWKHDTCLISFSLIVDDFGIKYLGKEHAQHMLDTVRQYYKCACEWEGERYCKLTLL